MRTPVRFLLFVAATFLAGLIPAHADTVTPSFSEQASDTLGTQSFPQAVTFSHSFTTAQLATCQLDSSCYVNVHYGGNLNSIIAISGNSGGDSTLNSVSDTYTTAAQVSGSAPIPESSTLTLFAIGLLGSSEILRRRIQST